MCYRFWLSTSSDFIKIEDYEVQWIPLFLLDWLKSRQTIPHDKAFLHYIISEWVAFDLGNCKKVRSNFKVVIPWQKSVVQQKTTENTQFWNLKLLSNANCISIFTTNKYFFSVSLWFKLSMKKNGYIQYVVQMILTSFYLASNNFQFKQFLHYYTSLQFMGVAKKCRVEKKVYVR